jgi:hypothetical protein
MANKLQIADELRGLLPSAIVKHIIATRETTDVVCAICREQTPASSPETLNVIVSHDRPTGPPIVQFAHQRCAPSGYTNVRTPPIDSELQSACRTAVRTHPTAPAVLLFEVWRRAMTDTGEDLELSLYHDLGLRSSPAGLTDSDPPRTTSLRLILRQTEARIELTRQGANLMSALTGSAITPASPGAVLHTFQLANNSALGLWKHTLARTPHCLLITGRTLGLDHPRLDRIDLLLKEGEALAAVIAAAIENGPPRTRSATNPRGQ